ncbi:hypothetical protein BG000_005389 [Podila horticola]|nr:hypothetical protein BG000_005389 [Podila horticola]
MASPVPLSRRKTDELTEIALSLGLSGDGQKKQLVERIQNYIDAHGTKDPMLKGLARDDTPEVASTLFPHRSVDEENLANISSAYEGGDSDGGIDDQVTKTTSRKTTTKTAKIISSAADKLHDVGSTSRGLVLLTLLLETTVFLTSAYAISGTDHSHNSWWALVTTWKDFLWPIFLYYGTLFVLPTLLSQLFNVDISRSQHTRHHRDHGSGPMTGTTATTKHATTGLLSPKTTSGLSYFVFKFAITYLLMPRDHGSHYSGIWQGCKALYEYIPATVGLAISGVGVLLTLAESVVSAH